MESIEHNSHSYYQLHEKIALLSLLKTEMRKQPASTHLAGSDILLTSNSIPHVCFFILGSIGFGNSEVQLDKKQGNINNNNNNNNNGSIQSTDDSNVVLQFHLFNISRERSLHLSKNTNDQRLLIFYNVSNGLYKIGLRNGE
jgi:hypothetical protein